ncbi:Guanine nucleotide-exchange protein [Musa troglodytarum]|uniref:Guanine nucleotide-exchange protein n=1 Tax=Musa troglodytarum TaxID=320322 RepID=A0A9E7EQS9_9LILI|nr:Guanine nucleotide-exchange protein [Musa troglodytarum]
MIRHMQEQFKEKAHKSESIYYSATDVVILKFMIEVCWAPMLAAFSVPVDQSDDETVISLCLEGFRSAVHVTAVMSMKTQRDAFVTSLAKFTSLHSAADIKQRNIDAIKAILHIADEDGNYLQEAWEHILTCVSRFEHLHLLGEGAPPDATFFTIQQTEIDKSKQAKSSILPALKKKGPSSIVARRGTYDSAGVGGHASGAVTSEQMNNLISNLNLLEQVGIAEVNRVFIRSEKLNSEAIIDFVKALCKVSMEELRSTSDPRVFSLTKIVEITYYNMDRIRLVWSSIWNVLSEFFVTIGCSENLSIAIFAMDSLRQLSMKFLERKELTNYNFQNEFMKPFVIVMRKSRAVEIRELIIRCVSQMVLARVSNVKSGWKSMFMYFWPSRSSRRFYGLLSYITETETTTFRLFNKDISLNAIAFLRFCAAKLAEGDIGASARFKDKEASGSIGPPSPHIIKDEKQDPPLIINKDDHLHLWFPLLAVFDSVLFPIFDSVRHAVDHSGESVAGQGLENDIELDQEAWLYETCKLALQLVVDLFVKFYDTVNPLLEKVLTLLTSFIKRPHQSLAGIGITAFVRLMSNAGSLFIETKWEVVVVSLKEATKATLPDFSYISSGAYLDNATSENGNSSRRQDNGEPRGSADHDFEGLRARNLYFAIGDAKCRAAVQLLLIQAVMEIHNMYRAHISAKNTLILFEALHVVACHAHKVNSDTDLRSKLQELGSMTQMQDPPLLRLENESYHSCLVLLQNIVTDRHRNGDLEAEACLVDLCNEVLEVYIRTAMGQPGEASSGAQPISHWLIPVGSAKRRELAARAPVVVSTLQAISALGDTSFGNNLARFFPLLAGLISCEHGSSEVQSALSDMLSTRASSLPGQAACVAGLLVPIDARHEHHQQRGAGQRAHQEAQQQAAEAELRREAHHHCQRQRHQVKPADAGVHAQPRPGGAPDDAAAGRQRKVDHLHQRHEPHHLPHPVHDPRLVAEEAPPPPPRARHRRSPREAREDAEDQRHVSRLAGGAGPARPELVGHPRGRARRQREHHRVEQVVEVEHDGDDRHHAPGVGEPPGEQHQDLVAPPLQARRQAAGGRELEQSGPLDQALLPPPPPSLLLRAPPCAVPSPPCSLRHHHVRRQHEHDGEVRQPDGRRHALQPLRLRQRDVEGNMEGQRDGRAEEGGEGHALGAQIGLERAEEGRHGEVREEVRDVPPREAGDVPLLPEAQQDPVDVEPQEGDGEGGQQQQDGGHEERLPQELVVLGAVGLAADGLHGGAEAGENREARDVGEGEAEGSTGQLELPEPAEERGGDGRLGEPRQVHGGQGKRDPPLRPELREDGPLDDAGRPSRRRRR